MTGRGPMFTHNKNQPHADAPFCYDSDRPKRQTPADQPHRT